MSSKRFLAPLAVFIAFGTIARAQNPVISNTAVAQVSPAEANGYSYQVYEDTRNAGLPSTSAALRFYIEPMFIPMRDSDGSIHFEEDELSKVPVQNSLGNGFTVTTRLTIVLMLKTSTELDEAAKSVKTAINTTTVAPSQIGIIPLQKVSVSIPDLDSKSPCKFVNPAISLAGTEPSIRLLFDCKDTVTGRTSTKRSVEDFRKHLHSMNATITVTYNAREADRASVNVDANQIASADFVAKLKGLGSGAYVSRDDARQLVGKSSQTAKIIVVGRELTPTEVNTCLSNQMLNLPDVVLDRNAVTPEVLKQTFNGDDLNPTKVEKDMTDKIDKSSDESHVIIKAHADGEGLFGLVKAGFDGSGDVFKKTMEEHGVKTEWDGQKWIPKGIDVIQVNTATLATDISRSCVFQTYAKDAARAETNHPLVF